MVGIKNNKSLLVFLIPAAIFLFIFSYLPLVGLLMAFVDYDMFAAANPIASIFASPWVGLDNFKEVMGDPYYWQVFRNTLSISIMKIIVCFPIPIILAIMINELIWPMTKRVVQTIIYMPHFLSWVIVAGIWIGLLGSMGLVNSFLINIGLIEAPLPFFTNNFLFRIVILFTDAWKEAGWGAIIYLAALTSIDSELYEAIKIDGGNKLREIFHVTLPGIASTIAMMFILRVSGILGAGFDQIFNMYNVSVYEYHDIIDTYIYRLGMGAMEYSVSTAMGLFNGLIGFGLMITANTLIKKYANRSMW